jgi:hypothetical protein
MNFYKLISKYSDNKIKVGVTPNKDLACISNDYLDYSENILNVPKELSLCPYYLFPFKYEIIEFLKAVDDLKDTIGKDQKFSLYILTYYLLYFMYAPKKSIDNYILQNKLEKYYNCDIIDDNLKDAFPNLVLNSATLEARHYEKMKKMGYNLDVRSELATIFKFRTF